MDLANNVFKKQFSFYGSYMQMSAESKNDNLASLGMREMLIRFKALKRIAEVKDIEM